MKRYLGGNQAKVMDLIRRAGPISQAQIAKILSLQPSTILRNVTELMDEGFIISSGMVKASAKGGRRATLLELNPKGAYAVGVDIGMEKIITVLVDLSGRVAAEIRKDWTEDEDAQSIMDKVKASIHDIFMTEAAPAERVLGIAVSLPGKVDSEAGVSVYALNLRNWRNVPVASTLEQEFGLPVYVEHDIRAMAFGEMWFGEDCQNMICMGYRGGIGLGIVINGEVYRGSNQFAGDVGHVVVDPSGPLCECGRKGCLEALSSEKALLNKFRKLKGPAEDAPFAIQDVYDAMKQGDQEVLDLIQETAVHMGKVLSDLVRIFDSERLVVGGNRLATSEEFIHFIRKAFQENQPNYADPDLEIQSSHFGEQGIAVGSAAIVISRLF